MFVNLSLDSALFPGGPADPLDPTAFHDLLSNTRSLISKFQIFYKARSLELQRLRAEASIPSEEAEEVETRARHLRSQFDAMAAQLVAQEKRSDALERMLDEERSRRKEAEDKSDIERANMGSLRDEGKKKNEKRNLSNDSGFESDGASVYSVQIPNFSPGDTPLVKQTGGLKTQGGQYGEIAMSPLQMPVPFQNYTGFATRSPFGSVDLRDENQQLRLRVLELEIAVDGCMEMITNPWR
jgi:hypothetical protein